MQVPCTLNQPVMTHRFPRRRLTCSARSLLGVPLIAGGGTLLGVLDVGTLTMRRFAGDETQFLQLAAARGTLSVQSLLTRAERAGAMELQRSLAAAALPPIPRRRSARRVDARREFGLPPPTAAYSAVRPLHLAGVAQKRNLTPAHVRQHDADHANLKNASDRAAFCRRTL